MRILAARLGCDAAFNLVPGRSQPAVFATVFLAVALLAKAPLDAEWRTHFEQPGGGSLRVDAGRPARLPPEPKGTSRARQSERFRRRPAKPSFAENWRPLKRRMARHRLGRLVHGGFADVGLRVNRLVATPGVA